MPAQGRHRAVQKGSEVAEFMGKKQHGEIAHEDLPETLPFQQLNPHRLQIAVGSAGHLPARFSPVARAAGGSSEQLMLAPDALVNEMISRWQNCVTFLSLE